MSDLSRLLGATLRRVKRADHRGELVFRDALQHEAHLQMTEQAVEDLHDTPDVDRGGSELDQLTEGSHSRLSLCWNERTRNPKISTDAVGMPTQSRHKKTRTQ